MKVLDYSTYSKGGAGLALLRIHSSLLAKGLDSEASVLYKDPLTQTPHVHDFRTSLGFFKNWRLKFANKKRVWSQNAVLNQFGRQPELFSFFDAVWDITNDRDYDQADIIHLHWVSGFLDFSTFFRKNKKPVLFTVQDRFATGVTCDKIVSVKHNNARWIRGGMGVRGWARIKVPRTESAIRNETIKCARRAICQD